LGILEVLAEEEFAVARVVVLGYCQDLEEGRGLAEVMVLEVPEVEWVQVVVIVVDALQADWALVVETVVVVGEVVESQEEAVLVASVEFEVLEGMALESVEGLVVG
jgi:hypothetical protein